MFKLNSFVALAIVVASATTMAAAAATPVSSTTATGVAVNPDGKASAPFASNTIQVSTLCVDSNFGNCWFIDSTIIPTGCINLPNLSGVPVNELQDSVSSAQNIPGITCTLFEDINCGGRSVAIGGAIADLTVVDFNDITTSMSCSST